MTATETNTAATAANTAADLGWTLTLATEIECCQGRTLTTGHLTTRHECPKCNREAWQTTGTLVTTAPGAGFYFAAHRTAAMHRFIASQAAKRAA